MKATCRFGLHFLRLLVSVVTGALLVVMLVAVSIQVVSRFFGVPISGAAEIAIFAQVWMVMLGAGLAMRHAQHVGVDIIIRQCSPRLQQVITTGAMILCLWFLGVIFVASFYLIDIAKFQTASSTGLPMTIAYAALPAGSLYFALELIIAMWPTVSMKNGQE